MSFKTLPTEIAEQIASYCDAEALRELCQTCRTTMRVFARHTYRTVVLGEDAASGRSVLAIASGPRAGLVRRLVYAPRDPRPAIQDEGPNEDHDPSVVLSDETRRVLSSLQTLHALEAFSFDLSGWDLTEWEMPFSMSNYDFEEYHRGEDEEPWRELINKSLEAVCESTPGAFERLEVKNLPPVPPLEDIQRAGYSAMYTDAWRAMLGSLKTLVLQLAFDKDEGGGSLTVAHQEYLEQLPTLFLAHLSSVEHLRVAGHRDGIMVGHSTPDVVPWSQCTMPRLRRLEVTYGAIGYHLPVFIINHADSLERVFLGHCLGQLEAQWSNMLYRVAQRDPKQLVEFRMVALTGFSPRDHWWPDLTWNEADDEFDESEGPEHWYADVKPEDKRRAFARGETCESYGQLQGSWDDEYERWELPEDGGEQQLGEPMFGTWDSWDVLAHNNSEAGSEPFLLRQWDRLQEIVQRNRAAAKLGEGRPALIEACYKSPQTSDDAE